MELLWRHEKSTGVHVAENRLARSLVFTFSDVIMVVVVATNNLEKAILGLGKHSSAVAARFSTSKITPAICAKLVRVRPTIREACIIVSCRTVG